VISLRAPVLYCGIVRRNENGFARRVSLAEVRRGFGPKGIEMPVTCAAIHQAKCGRLQLRDKDPSFGHEFRRDVKFLPHFVKFRSGNARSASNNRRCFAISLRVPKVKRDLIAFAHEQAENPIAVIV